MQLGHFSEPGMKTDALGVRSQRTLFDVPGPLAVSQLISASFSNALLHSSWASLLY
jgi:hypothetical protein